MRVVDVVNTWKLHFTNMGVSARDIESLAQQIDGDYLLQQRIGFEPGRFVASTGKRPRKSSFNGGVGHSAHPSIAG
jgi:serine/threonine-protein kinase HipA